MEIITRSQVRAKSEEKIRKGHVLNIIFYLRLYYIFILLQLNFLFSFSFLQCKW